MMGKNIKEILKAKSTTVTIFKMFHLLMLELFLMHLQFVMNLDPGCPRWQMMMNLCMWRMMEELADLWRLTLVEDQNLINLGLVTQDGGSPEMRTFYQNEILQQLCLLFYFVWSLFSLSPTVSSNIVIKQFGHPTFHILQDKPGRLQFPYVLYY